MNLTSTDVFFFLFLLQRNHDKISWLIESSVPQIVCTLHWNPLEFQKIQMINCTHTHNTMSTNERTKQNKNNS